MPITRVFPPEQLMTGIKSLVIFQKEFSEEDDVHQELPTGPM